MSRRPYIDPEFLDRIWANYPGRYDHKARRVFFVYPFGVAKSVNQGLAYCDINGRLYYKQPGLDSTAMKIMGRWSFRYIRTFKNRGLQEVIQEVSDHMENNKLVTSDAEILLDLLNLEIYRRVKHK